MKKSALLYIALVLLFACKTGSNKQELSPTAFEAAIRGDVQLLDVRTAGEFQSGHLRHALQADWRNKAAFKERTRHLNKTRPVFIYCAGGSRSKVAGDYLVSAGYKVIELEGGLDSWKASSRPIEQLSNEQPITAAEYKVLTNFGPVVLVDIGADWCPPCKKMDPVISQLTQDLNNEIKVVRIDAGMQSDLMLTLNAEKIPTFIIYKNGVETWRKEGIVDADELRSNLKQAP